MSQDSAKNRAAHIATCQLRRKAHVVEERDGEGWKPVFDGSPKPGQTGKGVNRAKRFIRERGERSYNA